MADVNYTANHPSFTSIGVNGYKWETLTSTNKAGTPIEISRMTDRTIQVTGTWGGETLVIEGSLDGTNYATLNDLQGVALSFTSGTPVEGVSEMVTYIRPRITSSAGSSVDLDVFLIEVGRGG